MRTTIPVLLIFLIAALPLHAADRLPEDVRQFIEQRDTCEHFRGEIPEPEQRERMKEVNRGLKKFCRGTDRRLALLKKKYGKNPPIQRRLAGYESHIEPGSQAPVGGGR